MRAGGKLGAALSPAAAISPCVHRAQVALAYPSGLSLQDQSPHLTAQRGPLATRKAATGFLLTLSPLGCGVPCFQALLGGFQFSAMWLLWV